MCISFCCKNFPDIPRLQPAPNKGRARGWRGWGGRAEAHHPPVIATTPLPRIQACPEKGAGSHLASPLPPWSDPCWQPSLPVGDTKSHPVQGQVPCPSKSPPSRTHQPVILEAPEMPFCELMSTLDPLVVSRKDEQLPSPPAQGLATYACPKSPKPFISHASSRDKRPFKWFSAGERGFLN